MSMFKLICFFLMDIILLQPLKCIVTLFIRFAWCPSVSYQCIDKMIYKDVLDSVDAATGHGLLPNSEKIIKEVNDFKLNAVTEDGDGFKWIAILLASIYDIPELEKKKQELLDIVGNYITVKGTIGRHPLDNEERYDTHNFSGDMTSGLLYWLVVESKKFFPNLNKRPDIKEKLIKLWYSTTFKEVDPYGKDKHLLSFSHAKSEVGDDVEIDRGYLYRWFGLGPDVTRLLTWLLVGYRLTDDPIFYRMFYILRICYFPLLLLDRGDYGIFVKKWFMVSWYTVHSNVYTHTAYYLLTDSKLAEYKVRKLIEGRYWNMSMCALWNHIFIHTTTNQYKIPGISTIIYVLERAMAKGTLAYTGKTQRYLDIKNREYKELPDSWCIPEQLGHKYLYENNPMKPILCDDKRRKTQWIDVLIAKVQLLK